MTSYVSGYNNSDSNLKKNKQLTNKYEAQQEDADDLPYQDTPERLIGYCGVLRCFTERRVWIQGLLKADTVHFRIERVELDVKFPSHFCH